MQLTSTPLLLFFSLARASPFRVDQRHSVPIQRCGGQTYAANEYICYAELQFLLCPMGTLPCPRGENSAEFNCYSPTEYECDNATLVVISRANPSPSPTAAPPSASAPVSVSASATPVPISSAVSSYAPVFSSPTAAPSEAVVVIPLPVLSSGAAPAPVSSAMSSAAVPSANVVVPSSASNPDPSVAAGARSADAVASSMAEADHD